MKKLNYRSLILFLAIANIAFGQVTGTLLMGPESLPGAEIRFQKSKQIVQSDFDGNFILPVSSESANDTLVISYQSLSIEIKNFKLNNGKIDIGNFELPYFMEISISDYEQLPESEKKNCEPTYCWGQLLGYFRTDKLDNDYLILNCKEKIGEFNLTNKVILVDWSLIKKCI